MKWSQSFELRDADPFAVGSRFGLMGGQCISQKELFTSTLSSIWLQVEQGFDPTAIWLQSALAGWQDIAGRLPVVSCCHYSAMSSLPPPIMPEVLTKWALLLIFPLSQTGRDSLCICTCTCRECRVKCFGDPPIPPIPRTHSLQCCLAFWLLSSGSLSYSWTICLGYCCVRCVSNRTLSVPTVQLFIVSSSTKFRQHWCRGDNSSDFAVRRVLSRQFNLLFKVRASGSSMLENQAKPRPCRTSKVRNMELKLNPIDNEVVRMDLKGKGVSEGNTGAPPGPLQPW